jgi:hypothetical protein
VTLRLKALTFLTSLAVLAVGCRVEPTPPIALKFIGIVAPPGKPKIAVLREDSGPPVHGKERDVVLGRYRILKIGEETIEMAYSDGRPGRQVIRLTGYEMP